MIGRMRGREVVAVVKLGILAEVIRLSVVVLAVLAAVDNV